MSVPQSTSNSTSSPLTMLSNNLFAHIFQDEGCARAARDRRRSRRSSRWRASASKCGWCRRSTVRFCGVKCQRARWASIHKLECYEFTDKAEVQRCGVFANMLKVDAIWVRVKGQFELFSVSLWRLASLCLVRAIGRASLPPRRVRHSALALERDTARVCGRLCALCVGATLHVPRGWCTLASDDRAFVDARATTDKHCTIVNTHFDFVFAFSLYVHELNLEQHAAAKVKHVAL